jgi:hypothetical protein
MGTESYICRKPRPVRDPEKSILGSEVEEPKLVPCKRWGGNVLTPLVTSKCDRIISSASATIRFESIVKGGPDGMLRPQPPQ